MILVYDLKFHNNECIFYFIFESIDYSMSSVMFAFKLNIEKFFKFVICMINLFFYNIGLNMMIYKIVSESIIQT